MFNTPKLPLGQQSLILLLPGTTNVTLSFSTMQQKNIVIVGAGLVGSLLGIYLKRRGHNVEIFERRPDMRKSQSSAGRSINLTLSDRGFVALEKIGLVEQIKKI